MERRDVTAALLVASWPGWLWAAANESDAAAGIRAALERGALAAVGQLGRADGFLKNPTCASRCPAIWRTRPS